MLFQSSYHNTYKSDKIFIFTPQGDLKQLPIGSTMLDFAYEIHSKLGDTCNGARINGRVVPIRYVLNNGDRVEIITSKKQSPRTDWLNFVTTDKAKNKIRRFLKEEEMREAGVGKGTLQRRLKNWKLPDNEEIITMLVKEYKLENSLQLYNKIALEEIELSDIKKFLTEELAEKDEKPEKQDKEVVETFQKSNVEAGDECLSIGEDISNVNYKLAKCCNPIPGEPVFGFVTTEGNMTIHRINCPNAKSLRERYGYRIIKVKWNGMEDGMPCAIIRIMGEDVMGLLGKITKVISDDLKVNMKHIALNSYKEGLFDGKIVVQVLDMETLDRGLGVGGGGQPRAVGAGDGHGAGAAQQLQGQGVVGHAQGHGPARLPQVPAQVGPRIEDEGQRPGPEGRDERPGGGERAGDDVEGLGGVGDEDRRRHAAVLSLGGQEPAHARGVGG